MFSKFGPRIASHFETQRATLNLVPVEAEVDADVVGRRVSH